MMWLLKLSFDQNSIMINHKFNNDFNNHIIFNIIQIGLLELLNILLGVLICSSISIKLVEQIIFSIDRVYS